MERLKPFMRIVLDEMRDDPDPVDVDEQATVVDYDDAGNLMVSWDCGRSLSLIPGVDKFHVVRDDELDRCFEQLRKIQEKVADGDSSRCPRCGEIFDCRRGAVSRRVNQIRICDLCGQKEAIEDFLVYRQTKVEIYVPADKNKTGFDAVDAGDGRKKLDVKVVPVTDWYIIKIWQGRMKVEEDE